MKVRKVVRRIAKDGNKVAAVNAVVASSIGEPGGTVASTSTQHVEIRQRNGHTEVREHHSTDRSSTPSPSTDSPSTDSPSTNSPSTNKES